ncbi:hypothetical protein [Ideonella livida]|uniref:PsiF repeat protein n=1 Tax=Ideonella livida TaxID=2707176 RepID=A0A7C9TM20_9BURK|nr:hypothetical protein [Ideonella livida]NDY92007.1 hypothetical protein [Ideonella livida]
MQKLIAAVSLSLLALAGAAHAADPAPADKGPNCMEQVKAQGLKGDEAKKALETCRAERKKHQEAAKAKREACRAELKGQKLGKEEHKKAMEACVAK